MKKDLLKPHLVATLTALVLLLAIPLTTAMIVPYSDPPVEAPPEGMNYAVFRVKGPLSPSTVTIIEAGSATATDAATLPDVLLPVEERVSQRNHEEINLLGIYLQEVYENPYDEWFHLYRREFGLRVIDEKTDLRRLKNDPLGFQSPIVQRGVTDNRGRIAFLLDRRKSYEAYFEADGYKWRSCAVVLPEWPAYYSRCIKLEPTEWTVASPTRVTITDNIEHKPPSELLYLKEYEGTFEEAVELYSEEIPWSLHHENYTETIPSEERWHYMVYQQFHREGNVTTYTNLMDGETVVINDSLELVQFRVEKQRELWNNVTWVPDGDWIVEYTPWYLNMQGSTVIVYPELWNQADEQWFSVPVP